MKHIGTYLFLFFFMVFASPALSTDKPPIIDIHMHAQPIKAWGMPEGSPVPRINFPDGFLKECLSPSTDDDILKQTIAQMEKHNIILGFLSGAPKDVEHWVKFAPKKFMPSPLIPIPEPNGKYLMPSIDYLRAEHAAGRIMALGEFISQYHGMAPNDPKLEPYFDLAEELDIPVLIHTLGIGGPVPSFRSYNGRPLLLEDVVVKRPKLRIWVENAGWPFLDEFTALMYQYPQVYADLSTISWVIPRKTFHDYLKKLIDAGLGKRLMFGSDQMIWPETISLAIDSIEAATFLTEEQKRDIFYNNAARFLRLDKV